MNDCSVLYWPISRFCRSRDNVSLVKFEIKTDKIVGQLRRLLGAAPLRLSATRQGGLVKNRQNWKLKYQRFESFLISLKEAPSIKIVTKYVTDRSDKGNIFVKEKLPVLCPKSAKSWNSDLWDFSVYRKAILTLKRRANCRLLILVKS